MKDEVSEGLMSFNVMGISSTKMYVYVFNYIRTKASIEMTDSQLLLEFVF